MRTVRGTCLVIALALVAVACASETGPAVLESVPPETVPSDWITFTDETASFKISYPNDWGTFELDDAAEEETLSSVRLFLAGRPDPSGPGTDPSANIRIEYLPSDLTVDEYAAAASSRAVELSETWEQTSQSKVRVGGRDAVILRGSYDFSELFPDAGDFGRLWIVSVLIVDEQIGWAINCGTTALEASEAADRLETCEQVVRSFELLTP